MKKVMKRLVYMLLVLSVVLACVPAVVRALPVHFGRFTPLQRTTVIFPNPLDPDQQIRTVQSEPSSGEMLPFAGEEEYLSDIQTAAAVVREGMKNRENVITVLYQAPVSQDFSTEVAEPIWKSALAHTGDPTEGDYLQWQWETFSAGASGYSDGVTNYYTVEFSVTYYTTSEQEVWMDTAVAELLTGLDVDGATDYEKLCAVYDWMCDNIYYDNDNLNDESYKLKYTAYAALHDKTSVCQGYALLLYRLMLEQGIDCRVITGIGNGGAHAWNIVELDGKYYNLDATWDASWHQSGLEYNFFLRTDSTFEDHTRGEEYATDAFNTAYPMGTADYTPTTVIASGTHGQNLTWVLTDDGTLTISGEGEMYYNYYGNTPWYEYRNNIKALVVEDGVTSICPYAFKELGILTEATIPASVNSIGEAAFRDCTSLRNVHITNIAAWCKLNFGNVYANPLVYATNLYLNDNLVEGNLVIPEGVTSIGAYAFYGYEQITEITIPESITSIGYVAFQNCRALRNVYITDIAAWCNINFASFESNPLIYSGSLYLNGKLVSFLDNLDGVTSIGSYAFYSYQKLAGVTIPDSVTTVGDRAFAYCDGLTIVTIGSGVTSIGDSAFVGSENLHKVVNHSAFNLTIGSTEHGYAACYAKVLVDQNGNRMYADPTWVETEDNLLYSCVDGVYTLHAYVGEEKTITLPVDINGNDYVVYCFRGGRDVVLQEGITDIDANAFKGCNSLTSIVIPNSVTSIEQLAFQSCETLTSIRIPDSVISIGDRAFWLCDGLENVTIGNNVATIGDDAFNGCISLTSIVIPDSVISIGQYAFYHCDSLTSITIGSGVSSIGDEAFNYNKNLVSITVSAENQAYCSVEGVLFTKDMKTLMLYPAAKPGAHYIIADGVVSINEYAFIYCKYLESITISDSVTQILDSAFENCVLLSNVTIGNSVETIGNHAFSGCIKLTAIIIPDSVTYIYDSIFEGCISLESVTFGNGLTRIGCYTFRNCDCLKSIVIPNSVTIICGKAFYDCDGLTSILIGSGVEVIEEDAFSECDNLWHILYMGTEDEWNAITFYSSGEILPEVILHYNCTGDEIIQAVMAPTCVEQGYTAHTCTLCNESYNTDYVDATGHRFGKWYRTSDPTCVQEGADCRDCAVCGYSETQTVAALGHTEVIDVAVAATCTTTGLTEGKHCAVCGEVLVRQEEIPVLGHSYDDGVVTTAPVCTEKGVKTFTCATCGDTYSEEIAATGHTEVTDKARVPTCTETGLTEGTHCAVCGQVLQAQEEIPANGHSYSSAVTDPTCTEAGFTTYTCTVCDDTYTDDMVDALGHTHGEAVTENKVEATCTTDGSYDTVVYCTVCHVEVSRETTVVNALGHTHGEAVTENKVEATCTTDGRFDTVVYCTVCCAEVSRENTVVAALGHTEVIETAVAPTCTATGLTEGSHCSVCGEVIVAQTVVDVLGHDMGEWTEERTPACNQIGTERRACSRCDHVETRETVYGEHTYFDVVTAPTCVEQGYTTHTCSVCGDCYQDSYVDAKGHSYVSEVIAPTCTDSGYTKHTCSACGFSYNDGYVDKIAHSFEVTVTEPTCISWGVATYTCSACGYSYAEQTEEPLEHNYVYEITVAPTCETEGEWLYTCTGCGDSYTEVAGATGHRNLHLENQKAVTCLEDGYSGDSVCDDCGKTVYYGEVIPAIGFHSYSVTTVSPGCETPGAWVYTCDVCGEVYTEEIAATGHSTYLTNQREATCGTDGYTGDEVCYTCGQTVTYGSVIAATGEHSYTAYDSVAPGCETPGQRTHTCGICGNSYTEEIPATGHGSTHTENKKAATCLEDGYTGDQVCDICGQVVEYGAAIPAAGEHSYASWEITAPGCETAGEYKYKCLECGHTYYDEVPATGHQYITVNAAEPTCGMDGYTGDTVCSRCGQLSESGTFIPATGLHEYTTEVLVEPTCEGEGLKNHVCANCGNSYTEQIPATGHSYVTEVISATCTSQGYTVYTCSTCGYSYTADYTDLIEHHYWVETIPATCTEAGYVRYACLDCGYSYQETLAATGHQSTHIENAVDATCGSDGYTGDTVCDDCGTTISVGELILQTGNHSFGEWEIITEPTEYTTGFAIRCCQVCSLSESQVLPVLEHTTHDYNYSVERKEPNCTEDGYIRYQCRCGDSYTETIAALGHTEVTLPGYPATCTEDGMTDMVYCEVCHEVLANNTVIPATGHSYGDWYMVKEPSEYEDGLEQHDCQNCEHYETRLIPAAGHTHSYEAVVTVPTCTENGYTTYTCRCGDSYVADEVAALGHDEVIDAAVPPTCVETGLTEGKRCVRCSEVLVAQKEITATGHSYSDWYTVKEATEYEDGLEQRDCQNCEHYETRPIPATGHTHSYEAVVTAPTCTEDGYTTYTCSCGDSYIADEVAALGHMGDWTVIKTPTCTEKGAEQRTCSRCDHSETREVEAAGHKYEATVTDPTCTTSGYTTYTCHCGNSYDTDVVAPLGHEMGAWKQTKAPTCTEKGAEQRTCSRCDHVETRGVEAAGHKYEVTVTAPTCTTSGYTNYTCHCGYSYDTDVVPALGHSYGEWYTVKAATEYEDGLEQRDCANCGAAETRAIPAIGHTHRYEAVITAPTCTENGYTTYTCRCGDSYVADEVAALGHDEVIDGAVPPTCVETGLTEGKHCVRCSEVLVAQKEITATGHSYGDWYTVKEATEYEDGLEQRDCQNCDHSETRVIPSVGHTHSYEAVVTAPTCTENGYTTYTCRCGDSYVDDEVVALGHSYEVNVTEPTCTENGYTTHTCTNCGATYTSDHVDALGHSWDEGVVTKEPTTETEGEKTYTCTVCGETRTETIAKKEDVIYDIPEDDSVQIPENDCFEGGTTVTVEVIEEGETYETVTQVMENVAEQYVAYEFTATKDDVAVQPSGKLTVTFDIPTDYSNNVAVYYMDENGKLTQLEAVVDTDERTVTVELEHFSTYIVVDKDTAPDVLLGDVNGDGRINVRDARAILRYIAGLIGEDELEVNAADFNGDGRINVRDARAILNYIAGMG